MTELTPEKRAELLANIARHRRIAESYRDTEPECEPAMEAKRLADWLEELLDAADERDRLRAESDAILGFIQTRLQPDGSPPPGGSVGLVEWVTARTRERIAELEADSIDWKSAEAERNQLRNAIREDAKRAIRQSLGAALWKQFWGPELEQLASVVYEVWIERERMRADLERLARLAIANGEHPGLVDAAHELLKEATS